MSIFFTADTHFQHDAIRRYCNRHFASSDKMEDTLIANWNAVVTREDKGTIALGQLYVALSRTKARFEASG